MPLNEEQIQKIRNFDERIRARAANHPNSPRSKWKRFRDEIMRNGESEIPEIFSDDMLKLM